MRPVWNLESPCKVQGLARTRGDFEEISHAPAVNLNWLENASDLGAARVSPASPPRLPQQFVGSGSAKPAVSVTLSKVWRGGPRIERWHLHGQCRQAAG